MKSKTDHRDHWDRVYRQKTSDQLSWYQSTPTLSLQWINSLNLRKDAVILDVGGGVSSLVDALVDAEFAQVHVLDISAVALALSQQRLGQRAQAVEWHCADILDFECAQKIDLWHDRAVLHFINKPEQQARYVGTMQRLLAPNANVILAPFAQDGPEQCSALPVTRYSPQSLAKLLGPRFELREHLHTTHTTPWGSPQAFLFARFRFNPE